MFTTVKTSQKNIHTQTNLVYEIRLFGLGGYQQHATAFFVATCFLNYS